MYYTPAIVIPGKLAHITLEGARSSAKYDKSYVMDNDFVIIERYGEEDATDTLMDLLFNYKNNEDE